VSVAELLDPPRVGAHRAGVAAELGLGEDDADAHTANVSALSDGGRPGAAPNQHRIKTPRVIGQVTNRRDAIGSPRSADQFLISARLLNPKDAQRTVDAAIAAITAVVFVPDRRR
jgi:hypothetical protein